MPTPRGLLTLLLLAFFPSACGPATGDREPADHRPSILFLSIDTLSARHMSTYGYSRATTPEITRFAEHAVTFDHCSANAPWTTPSYMSQFTGLYPTVFTVEADEDGPQGGRGRHWYLADGHVALAELFQQNGYRTAAFVDNLNISASLGFAQGFELYDESAADISIDDPAGGIRHIVPLALDWLDGREEGSPFFLFLQSIDVHGPYLPEEPWKGFFSDTESPVEDHEVPVALEHDLILGAIPRYIADAVRKDDETSFPVRPFVDAYDEEIRALDAQIGALLQELDTRGLLDECYVVIGADHGESMVEHRSYFNHQLLHGEDLHVPLLIRPPGGLPQGRRVETPVQLVDLYPTLAELAGLPPPGGLHGRSLVPAMAGRSLSSVPLMGQCAFLNSRSIVVDGWKLVETKPSPLPGDTSGFFNTPQAHAWIAENFPEYAGLTFGTHELPPSVLDEIRAAGRGAGSIASLCGPFHALYDLRNDPGELHDLSEEKPEVVEALLAQLEAEDARAAGARIEDGEIPPIEALSEKTLEELRRLGYVDRDRD